MACWAPAMPSAKLDDSSISVATSSVGLTSLPLISEKCVVRLPNAWLANSSRLVITPTVTSE